MTTQTFIAPDGKLYTYKKYVNWEGVRQVEGVNQVRRGRGAQFERCIAEHYDDTEGYIRINVDFTIQD